MPATHFWPSACMHGTGHGHAQATGHMLFLNANDPFFFVEETLMIHCTTAIRAVRQVENAKSFGPASLKIAPHTLQFVQSLKQKYPNNSTISFRKSLPRLNLTL